MNAVADVERAAGPRPQAPGVSHPRPAVDARQRSSEIQRLIEQAAALPDPAARDLLQRCLQAVLALYGEGLERILQLLGNAGPDATAAREALLQDKLVCSLLLIHGLHPDSLATRIAAALEKIRPYLQSHGGNVELVRVEDDVAHLRLQGTCKSCPSSSATLELAVRQTVEEACPDLLGFEVEGVPAAPAPRAALPQSMPRWTMVEGLGPMAEGRLRSIKVAEVPVMICQVRGSLYAYRNYCPACRVELHDGVLMGDILSCRGGHRFDVRHAGLGCDNQGLHLEPLPLIATGEGVKVSVNARAPDK